jgi:hypothetical protein
MEIRSKIWACFAAMVLIFTVAEIGEGEEKGKTNMNLEISLPTEAEGWKWDGNEERYDSQSVFQYMNGAAELYLAYDFQNLRVRRFEKPDRPSITLELYDMASSENAYGVFSFERQDRAVGIGQGSEFGGDCSVSGKGSILSASIPRGRERRSNRRFSRWEGPRQTRSGASGMSPNWSV